MFSHLSDTKHIIQFITNLIIVIGSIGNILFGTVWCVYFLFRIKVLRKKVYYLKKQTDERYFDAINNAKVDYIKSIFIAAISFSEVMLHLFAGLVIANQNFIKLHNYSCGTYFSKYSYNSLAYRMYLSLTSTFIIMFVSLIHILTSYLSHAYSEKRITNIMRRERVMFAWLFIQLVCVWCSIFYWPLFILTLPIMTVVALIGHLCLYWKYGRELYSVIRRRERDALFEEVYSHLKLFKMLNYYKNDAILYFVYICVYIGVFIILLFTVIIQTLLFGDCQIAEVFHLDVDFLKEGKTTTQEEILSQAVSTACGSILIFPLLLIHISITYKLIKRMIKKRNEMYNPTKETRKTLHQPLIGNE